MLRKAGSALVALAMMGSVPALAAQGGQGALAPGKAAGVHKAQMMEMPHYVWIAGVGLVLIGLGVAASGGSSHNAVVTTSCAPNGTSCSSGTTTTSTSTTSTH